jgi:hypothetical protein
MDDVAQPIDRNRTYIDLPDSLFSPTRMALSLLGFVFDGHPNPHLTRATLPECWSVRQTRAANVVQLLDNEGRARVTLQYTYGANGACSGGTVVLLTRLTVDLDDEYDPIGRFEVRAIIRDAGAWVAYTEPVSYVEGLSCREAERIALQAASTMLTQRFPGWTDSSSYWGIGSETIATTLRA